VTFRPTPEIEVGAVYNSSMTLRTKGTGQSIKGVNVNPDRVVGPMPDELTRCERGGTFEIQKACITTQLPQNAVVGARYKFLDGAENVKGDVELDVNWENWGKTCDFTSAGQAADPDCASPSQILVKLDTAIYNQSMTGTPEAVKVNFVNLGLQDTFSIRLGGSYHIPQGDNRITVRGGLAYDTAAARKGWLRASFDGAARLTSAIGGAYRTKKWEVNAGGGFVYEGTNTNPGAGPGGADCNPTGFDNGMGQQVSFGCTGDGQTLRPLDQRQGPDPTNPLFEPEFQSESPYNQGTIKSHYVLFMLGFSTWF
jgi:long-subunit fatty acid transport protein